MNANLLTFGNMLLGSTSMVSVPTKAGVGRADKQFCLIQNDRMLELIPCEARPTDNVLTGGRKKSIKEPLSETDDVLYEKVKTEGPLRDQDTQIGEQCTVSDANEQKNSELNQGAKKPVSEEQISKVSSDTIVSAQLAQPILDSQTDIVSTITNGGPDSAENKSLVPNEGQAELKSVLANTHESNLTAKDPLGESVSNTKVSAFDNLFDREGKTIAGDLKTMAINIDSALNQAKSTQTLPDIAEENPENTMPTTVIASKLQNLNYQESMNDLSNLSAQKLSLEDVHRFVDQSKDRGRLKGDKSSLVNLEQIFSHEIHQTQTTQQSSLSAGYVKAPQLPGQNSHSDISADIGKQILESIQGSLSQQNGDRCVTIRLNPPELGTVFIKFQEQKNDLIGLMEVSKTETKLEIEQALPDLIRNIADCGIHLRRLDLTLSGANRSDHETLNNQWLQDNEPNDQDWANSETWRDDSDFSETNELLPNCNSYQNDVSLSGALITYASFNILI